MPLDGDLKRLYPHMNNPIHCENGCGTVIEVIEAFRGYERGGDGYPKLICPCCAAEIGHLDEDHEGHNEGPTCERKAKK